LVCWLHGRFWCSKVDPEVADGGANVLAGSSARMPPRRKLLAIGLRQTHDAHITDGRWNKAAKAPVHTRDPVRPVP
jgi:hypothetical protein